MASAIQALVEVAMPEQVGSPLPALALPLPLPGDGVEFSRERNVLFVPSPVGPPIGDDLPLRLEPTDGPPIEVPAVVMSSRAAGENGPGSPAGIVAALVAPSLETLIAVERHTTACNSGRPQRKAPRYLVRAPARIVCRPEREVTMDGVRLEFAHPIDSVCDSIENLSQNGTFVRTSRQIPPGTSIALNVVLPTDMLLSLNGTTVYRNERGVGVRFDLDPDGDALLATAIEQATLTPRRALVVDDDVLARRMLGEALTELGFEVFAAENGLAGLRVLADILLGLDLVVTDLYMPNMSGEEFLQRVRVAGGERDLSIVVVTALELADGRDRLVKAGADAVLSKNLGATLLAETADVVTLQKQMGVRQRVAPASLNRAS